MCVREKTRKTDSGKISKGNNSSSGIKNTTQSANAAIEETTTERKREREREREREKEIGCRERHTER
jgi:hypothetical protein